jgi:phosphatidylethanolamine/phosphatidyl-N-methylethanolamine N-methyltransferase
MSKSKNFRKQFWKNKNTVGAMAPSSRFLTKKMLENIDFKEARVIVELGPGTGVFTEEIISKMDKDAVLFVFEINETFYQDLQNKINDQRVHLIFDSAEKISDYLKLHHFEHADIIVSSLPLAVFSEQLRNSILNSTEKSLKTTGKYIQFQYSLQAKKALKSLYKKVGVSFTPFNFPPAFVYTCSK